MSSPSHQFTGSVEIDGPAALAHALWSDCANFPKFMHGVRKVYRLDERRLRWVAEMGGETMQWDAEILEEIPNEYISYRTTSGHPMAGTVRFEALGPERVRVTHSVSLEAVEEELDLHLVADDLQRFRDFAEGNCRPS